mmetsp:Transcript_84926/g.147306  ORF Transcript_84926/g.147306 Transcript_84926/m.147306 type:complete len:116 (+) Transcript_84926:39-386(+)
MPFKPVAAREAKPCDAQFASGTTGEFSCLSLSAHCLEDVWSGLVKFLHDLIAPEVAVKRGPRLTNYPNIKYFGKPNSDEDKTGHDLGDNEPLSPGSNAFSQEQLDDISRMFSSQL